MSPILSHRREFRTRIAPSGGGRRGPVFALGLVLAMLAALALLPGPVFGQAPDSVEGLLLKGWRVLPAPGSPDALRLGLAAQATPPGAPLDSVGRAVMDTVEQAEAKAREWVGGQSFLIGLSDQTAKLDLARDTPFPDGRNPTAHLTNNGEWGALVRYKSSESYLLELPMRSGHFRLGYDFDVSYTEFRTQYQETLNVAEGEDLGTTSSGKLFTTGGMIFVRLGPLYPDGRIFWKGGGGGGVGFIDFEADVLFRNNLSPYASRERINHRSGYPNLYLFASWLLEWENWQLIYLERNLRGETDFGSYFYSESSTIIGYTLRF